MIAQGNRPERNRPRIVLPIVLITLGVLVLLVNSGALGWGALLNLLQLWPLILVAIGLDLWLGGRYRLLIAVGTLALAAVIYAGVLAAPGGVAAQTHTLSQGLEGAQRADVQVRSGVSELSIGALAGSANLVEGSVQTGVGEQLVQNFSRSGELARYELATSQRTFGFFNVQRSRRWELALSPAVPIHLRVDTGVGRATLELAELQLSGLELHSGVGETVVTLPRTGRLAVTIDAGVGATTLRLPTGMAARIEVSGGLGAVTMPADFSRSGDVYLSPDYEGAQNRAEVRINGGVGAITVQGGL